MIHLKKGNTENIYLTLYEKQLISNPYYIFVFTNRTTGKEIKYITNTDVSPFKERYNKFSIVVNTYFEKEDTGEWIYKVYESATSTNTIVNLNLLESGIMKLSDSAFEYKTRKGTFNYVTK